MHLRGNVLKMEKRAWTGMKKEKEDQWGGYSGNTNFPILFAHSICMEMDAQSFLHFYNLVTLFFNWKFLPLGCIIIFLFLVGSFFFPHSVPQQHTCTLTHVHPHTFITSCFMLGPCPSLASSFVKNNLISGFSRSRCSALVACWLWRWKRKLIMKK